MNSHASPPIARPWASTPDQLLEQLNVSPDTGLPEAEARTRRGTYGPNRLRQVESKSPWQILLRQVKSLIVVLLAVAAILSVAFGEWPDALAIAGVILLNAGIGFFMEFKAVRSMESLRRMERVTTRVRREGRVHEVSAVELVPGDVVIIEGGDIVSADMRLIYASKLQADESVLTGESVPVGKRIERLEEETVLGDRVNMLFKGTAVTRGSGEAVVTSTGMHTELGHISTLVAEAQEAVTPLEKRLNRLGRMLLWATLVIIVIVALTGIARGKEIFIMIETAIALAVAAIPEGLPIVATLALARGMIRMARRNALVNELAAVETLGGTGVICTDKTGTLTENRMTVTGLILAGREIVVGGETTPFTEEGRAVDPARDERLREALEICALCNNASLHEGSHTAPAGVGDPLEVGLLIAAQKGGVDGHEIRRRLPEEREDAFDSDAKRMATFNRVNGAYRISVKGAPEVVLASCSRLRTSHGVEDLDDRGKQFWFDRNAELAEQGRRVLSLAAKEADSVETEPYEDLVFVGLVVIEDPPRADVRDAIEACQEAGIRVVMVTGDHPKTARSIASAVGLMPQGDEPVVSGNEFKPLDDMSAEDRQLYRQTPVFARVSPKQKLDLIDIHQRAGSIVAMTGDGVNDAPALKKADIGVAMGRRGTQVAQEAADMVLKDDAFSTIVVAVEQGRIIFDNIRTFVLYLLSCNVSEVMVVFAASLVNAPLPILPLQILFLNLVTDVFPALALGVSRGSADVMQQKPRGPDEPVLPARSWVLIAAYGLLLACSVLIAFAVALKVMHMSEPQAVTVSFLTLALAQMWHIFNLRGAASSVLRNEITANRYVWAALGLCAMLLLIAVYVPVLSHVLELANPGLKGWLLVLLASSITCLAGQAFKSVAGSFRRRS